jgi:CRP-like cAMP-binding protein
MITNQAEQLRPGKRICLQPSQALAFSRSAADQWLAINISDGIIRLATSQQQDSADITLAFLSHSDSGFIHHPTNQQLHIEAITETTFEILKQPIPDRDNKDVLSEWLFELHLIRNPRRAEKRLKALLELLVERLGKRTAEGFKLEFLLPHSRIAEIIGTTRSTVSRSIGSLRESGQIIINNDLNTLTLPLEQHNPER